MRDPPSRPPRPLPSFFDEHHSRASCARLPTQERTREKGVLQCPPFLSRLLGARLLRRALPLGVVGEAELQVLHNVLESVRQRLRV